MFLIIVLLFFVLVLSAILYTKLTLGINKCSKHLIGKVVIITGANTGIGYETAKDMAYRGARVILACRNEQRGLAAKNDIIAETGNEDVHFRQLDLASLSSVRRFADDILKNEKQLNILINNAGMIGSKYIKTEDGLLLDMQSNHLGPFLLTSILLPLLKSTGASRIINVSSLGHQFSKLDVNDLNMEKVPYNSRIAYGNTKLCNILMTVELSERLKGTGVTVNSLHPGAVDTDIALEAKNHIPVLKCLTLLTPLLKTLTKTRWEGAQTTIYLAVSPEVEGVSGYYYSDCRQKSTSKMAQDRNLARKLWEVSERFVKINPI
ncbi:retinol dehydrogenase 11-like [Achroia grisella]|uniref:retinol dehydrogenase 11-like n=1 Tax=Achroia grisella TaxID=688607 RepID=UPI0027D202B6|nr:retinol dehydrogenase 11-like [Achroia grisella]